VAQGCQKVNVEGVDLRVFLEALGIIVRLR
jgi:hypothetical protein